MRLQQIEDATVCEITGCVVHKSNFVTNEFDNTAMLRNSSSAGILQGVLSDDIEQYVRLLLTSRQSMQAHEQELAKITSKFKGYMLSGGSTTTCIFQCLEASMRRLHSARVLPHRFDFAEREAIVNTASQHIGFLVVCTRCRMPHMLRGLDNRTLVFGLLYLMRTGMTAHSVCLMPAITKLAT